MAFTAGYARKEAQVHAHMRLVPVRKGEKIPGKYIGFFKSFRQQGLMGYAYAAENKSNDSFKKSETFLAPSAAVAPCENKHRCGE